MCISENPYIQWTIATVLGVGICLMIDEWMKTKTKSKEELTAEGDSEDDDLHKAYEQDMVSLRRLISPFIGDTGTHVVTKRRNSIN